MATQISPGVNVSEVDLTASVQATSLSSAAFVGLFGWGPALDVVTVTSESDLVKVFGKPDANNYKHWFTAQSFLAYSNQLRIVRAVANNALNATANGVPSGAVTATGSTVTEGPGADFTNLKVGQTIKIGDNIRTINAISSGELTVSVPFGDPITENTALYAYGTLVPNEDFYEMNLPAGNSAFGIAMAKWAGALGNSLLVSLCPSSTAFESWAYADYFQGAPGTSAYAANFNGANDELHIVVVDNDGGITGVPGTVLEKYAFVSKASDAKNESGSTNYYKTVLNRESAYVWWMGHPSADSNTANWGAVASTGEFGADSAVTVTLVGGTDDNAHATDGNLTSAWDLFADVDSQDVSILVTGPSTLDEDTGTPVIAAYVIEDVAEVRKDCVAFVSPLEKSVVANAGEEAESVIADRDALSSTSYAVMDSGWKYTYDKYNDVYRWIPLNGDIAGLAVRTDTTNDPWFSPAGFNRGNIKNVVKLAWNPKQADRDDLYNRGINPVVSFPGQGVLLYGDKTLLSRPSAFDRINVRRLFIALEKTIARYAKAQLFEFNDEFTRAAFRSAVEPYLRDVKARRGITDYLVVCDNTNNTGQVIDANQFVGDIYVKPTRSINFIQLNFVAVRSGVSFQEVVGTV